MFVETINSKRSAIIFNVVTTSNLIFLKGNCAGMIWNYGYRQKALSGLILLAYSFI